jgi:hypothetical protein
MGHGGTRTQRGIGLADNESGAAFPSAEDAAKAPEQISTLTVI